MRHLMRYWRQKYQVTGPSTDIVKLACNLQGTIQTASIAFSDNDTGVCVLTDTRLGMLPALHDQSRQVLNSVYLLFQLMPFLSFLGGFPK